MARSIRERVRALRPPFRARRVELRWPSARLNGQVVAMMQDDVVHRWTLHIPRPYALADAAEFVRRARANRRSAKSLSWQIVRRDDGALLGGVGLHRLDEPVGTAEIGYLLGRPHRGQGYASEAVDAIVRVAFGRLGFRRIEAHVFIGNARSERVLRRCGFRREGRLRQAYRKDGRWVDVVLYARLRSDPSPLRRGAPSAPTRSSARSR